MAGPMPAGRLRARRLSGPVSKGLATKARFGLRESRKIAIMPGLFRRLQQGLEDAGDNCLTELSTEFYRARQSNQGFRPMANTAQARKRARQAEATRQRNASLKSSLRTAIKKVRKAIGAGDKAAATKELQAQQSVIDRIADKKVVHKNTASRSKARLAQAIKALP